jgi:hypothetical protein
MKNEKETTNYQKMRMTGGELGNLAIVGCTVIDHFNTAIAKTARLPICPLPYGI